MGKSKIHLKRRKKHKKLRRIRNRELTEQLTPAWKRSRRKK